MSTFLFVVCQRGAEKALKSEIAHQWPEFRFAYSRKGFVTFKLPPEHSLAEDFDLRSVFARSYGFSLGKLEGTSAEVLADEFWKMIGPLHSQHLHVWQRDTAIPGQYGFEPHVTPLANQVALEIVQHRSESENGPDLKQGNGEIQINQPVRAGQRVLDCVLVEPNQWWVGYHQASTTCSRWPGGMISVELPESAVSRAYLKMAEALDWSRLPLVKEDLCVEIGSSPGGSCQALLDRGMRVIGIDPAEMSPDVLSLPNFTHFRKRASEMKRRDFRGVRWLMADSNVAPKHTLDSVEAIVTHGDVHVKGMLLTLKLLNWEMAEELPQWIQRIRDWGYEYVKAKQLAHNRQEVCFKVLRRRSMRREPPWKKQAR